MVRKFFNRELSWISFDRRVLQLARESGVPLLERFKFAAICSSNLDEFFQVRVAALKDQVAAGVATLSADGLTPAQQLSEIGTAVSQFVREQEEVVWDVLLPELAEAGEVYCTWEELTFDERERMTRVFDEQIFPVLTPLAVDPAHPFPYVSSLAVSIGALVRDPDSGEERFARIKVPTMLQRFMFLGNGRFVSLDEVIKANLQELFPEMTIRHATTFRVTRNADLTLEDEEADDLLQAVEMELRRRRFGNAVRLEVEESIDEEMLEMLLEELDLETDDVYRHRGLLDLTCLHDLRSLDRPDLKDDPWTPVTAGRLAVADDQGKSFFSVIRKRDLMVHHPYESFASSTEEFIAQAAADSSVQTIKVTLYRTSGDSPIARSLIAAAERGAQVVVLIELKARFDEATNVTWAKALERAGVHVTYGVVGLKTHSKLMLVVRNEGSRIRRYVHIGTGNYNSKTARTYEDLGIFTCDDSIGEDVSRLFNQLTGFGREREYEKLIVSPTHLRPRLYELIDNEIRYGNEGHISVKVNGIADGPMVEKLYEAAEAGVRIDLLVRGICTLRPGMVPNSRLRVRSLLGRFLEHSRMYMFAHGSTEKSSAYFIGSADLMERNLDKRVEVLTPVMHPKHQAWLDTALQYMWADDVVAFELGVDDSWRRVGPSNFTPDHDAQSRLRDWIVDSQQRLGVPSSR
ncbi:MAG: polyphosphate kinase 1 [Actinomycetota bacterium]